MALTILNTSTLSEALTAETFEFTVGSTANIAVGNLLVIRQEAVKVQAIPVSGRVQVMRGVNGTEARAHASGQRFFIGAADSFKAIKDSATALVGSSSTFPDYLLPGQTAKDGAGNEYILLELTATCYAGTMVLISNDGNYTATPLVGGSQGRVALLVEPGTSDQYVWGQVRGYNSYAQDSTATSAASSTYVPVAASSVSTPDVGMAAISPTTDEQYLIHGMWIVGAATTATTAATSATGVAVPVFLHDPYVMKFVESVIDPTS